MKEKLLFANHYFKIDFYSLKITVVQEKQIFVVHNRNDGYMSSEFSQFLIEIPIFDSYEEFQKEH